LATSNYCAAKVIDLSALSKDDIMAMMREVSVFMQVQHAHICNLCRRSVVDHELVLFIEFAVGGTLLKHVNGCGSLKEPDTERLFGRLFSAMRHLHACHFLVHRNLKLENVKLTDFRLSSTCYGNVMLTFVGTGDEKCDVCMFAMMKCRLPFSMQSHSSRGGAPHLLATARRLAPKDVRNPHARSPFAPPATANHHLRRPRRTRYP
jgi:serine/threonine protein kinase